jgi:putative tryptophan/tyrosine transport system substrate-binding protein
MRRRAFIAGLGSAAVWPMLVRAQQPTMPVVGVLAAGSAKGLARSFAGFHRGLGEVGYVNGKNIKIESRWAEGQYDRLPAMAADLIDRRVTVVAAISTPAALVARTMVTTIPVVFTTIANPVQIGLVASLNRPGANVTGVTLLSVEVGPKLLSLLHEAVPSATTMALLVNPTNPNVGTQSKDLQAGVVKLGLQAHVLNASTERDFDPVFAKLRELRTDTLMIAQDPLFNAQSQQLAELAVRHAIPAIYELREFAEAGGLMSYGTSQSDSWRQAGIYVGRILKGEKAADLPVMQPSKFEFIVNLKTAKALGLEIPPSLLARADEVIE